MQYAALAAAFAGFATALDAPRTAIPFGLPSPSTQNVDDVRVLPANGGVSYVVELL